MMSSARVVLWRLCACSILLHGCDASDFLGAKPGNPEKPTFPRNLSLAEVDGYFQTEGCEVGRPIQVLNRTLDDCKTLCNADPACDAFAHEAGHNRNARAGCLLNTDNVSNASNAISCDGKSGTKGYNLYTKRSKVSRWGWGNSPKPVSGYELVVSGCVSDHNLRLVHDKSREECSRLCNADWRCEAFEYYRDQGSSNPRFRRYDCHLQTSNDPSNCRGQDWNLDLYIKVPPDVGGYAHMPRKCVNGHNLRHAGQRSLADCRAECNNEGHCVAFEYGVAYGGSGARKPGDCILQDHTDNYDCDGSHHNTDLYLKRFSTDRLTLLDVKCQKPASGFDDVFKAAYLVARKLYDGYTDPYMTMLQMVPQLLELNKVIVNGVVYGFDPLSYETVWSLAGWGSDEVSAILDIYDKTWAGQDDQLLLKVDGIDVLRETMSAGQKRGIFKYVSFRGRARVSFIEVDSVSDNDDIGSIDIVGGRNVWKERALILAPNEHDGSAYELKYKVDAGAGDPEKLSKYMLCGTNQCNHCPVTACEGSQLRDFPGLDRDKDKGDLKPCPIGFATLRFEKYPQAWPFADVYLRICRRLYN